MDNRGGKVVILEKIKENWGKMKKNEKTEGSKLVAVTGRKSINDSLEEMMTPLEFAESMKFNNDDSDLMQVIKHYPKFNGNISFKKNSDEDHSE